MTGLEKWAQANGATVQEIEILARASGLDWDTLFKPYAESDTEVPVGRGTAFTGLLERGRNNDVVITPAHIAGATGLAEATVNSIVNTDNIQSSQLPGILARIRILSNTGEPAETSGEPNTAQANNEPEPDEAPNLATPAAETTPAEPNDGPTGESAETTQAPMTGTEPLPASTPAAPTGRGRRQAKANTGNNTENRPAPRRKTKYSVNKNIVADILKPQDSTRSVRDIRAFLLSLPEYKPNDVALMSDDDVLTAFNGNYKTITMGAGAMIISQAAYAELSSFLTTVEAYYIPETETTTSEG